MDSQSSLLGARYSRNLIKETRNRKKKQQNSLKQILIK